MQPQENTPLCFSFSPRRSVSRVDHVCVDHVQLIMCKSREGGACVSESEHLKRGDQTSLRLLALRCVSINVAEPGCKGS